MKKWIVNVMVAGSLMAPMVAPPAYAVDEAVQVQLLKQLFRSEQADWLRILTENNRVLDQSFFERCDARIRWAMENSQVDDAVRFAFVADLGSKAVGKKGRYRLTLAQFFLKKGNINMFNDLIDNILLMDPEDTDAPFLRAEADLAGNANLVGAYDVFKTLHDKGYNRGVCSLNMAKISLLMQNTDLAKLEFKRAVDEGVPEGQKYLDEIAKNEPKIVPEGFQSVSPAGGPNTVTPQVAALFEDAEKAYRAQDLSAAEGGYIRVLQANPNHAKARCNLGALYYRANALGNAIEQLEVATKLDGSDRDSWHYLGNCYERRFDAKGNREDLERAVSAYQQGLRVSPSDRPLQVELYRVQGKKSGAAHR